MAQLVARLQYGGRQAKRLRGAFSGSRGSVVRPCGTELAGKGISLHR